MNVEYCCPVCNNMRDLCLCGKSVSDWEQHHNKQADIIKQLVAQVEAYRKCLASANASELSSVPSLQIPYWFEPSSELGSNQAKPIQADPRQPGEATEANGANATQHGGTHYKSRAIQPWDYVVANGLGFLEGNAIKYLTRWRDKGGIEDLLKAQHYIVKLIEVESEKAK